MHVNVALVTKVEKILPTPEVSIMSACMCIIVPSTHILAIYLSITLQCCQLEREYGGQF